MFQTVRKWVGSAVACLGLIAGVGAQVAAPVVQTAAVAVQSVGGTSAVVAAAAVFTASEVMAQTAGETGSFEIDAPVDMGSVTDSVSSYLTSQMGKVIALAVGILLIWKLFRWIRRAV